MEKELANLKELNSKFDQINQSLQKTVGLLEQLQRNTSNSRKTLQVYEEVQNGVQANIKLFQRNQASDKLVIDTLDEDIDAMKARVALLKTQLEKLG